MILRAMGLGFVLWLAIAAVFRLWGQYFFLPDETPRLLAFIAAPVLGVLSTVVLLKLLKEAPGDEGEGAIGLALPSLFLNAFVVHEFPNVLPNIDPTLDTPFAVLTLLFAASILFTGLSMTKLALADERI